MSVRKLLRAGLGLGAAAFAAACDTTPAGSVWRIGTAATTADSCDRPDAQKYPSGVRVVLSTLNPYCDIVALPLAILRSSEDDTHPDPGSRLVITSDGRYYTTSARGHRVLEWDRHGNFVRAVGGPGHGDGEFDERGGLVLFLDANDSLFVLDGGQRWTVYDPDLQFRRNFVGRSNGRIPSTLNLASGQGILTTATMAVGNADPSSTFHVMDFEGNLVRSFGPAHDGPASSARLEQASSLDGQGRIWVAPPNGAASGLLLERWTFAGQRDLTLERRAGWMPEAGYPGTPDPEEPRLPEYDLLHVDDEGLIWVAVIVRDPRWRSAAESRTQDLQNELYDARVEVIDPASATVLASYRYDGPHEPLPPFARFARTTFLSRSPGQG